MSDRQKGAEEKMAKAIFISADCWLCVFDLITPSQLGFGIAMISHRFDYYVDEHFRTRKWALKPIRIQSKIGKNGTKEMDIVNDNVEALPIPQIQVPRKVIGFRRISIFFIDRNAITFLHRLRPLFAACPITLTIDPCCNDRTLEFILLNIWPMFGKNIHGLRLSTRTFHRLRQFAPSILNDCPSLRLINTYYYGFFIEFPADDSAAASDGQAVAKWLFTPRSDNVPKVFRFGLDMNDGNWSSNIEPFKAAFVSASSPVNFIIGIWFASPFPDSVVPFDLTNEMTREQLTLKRMNDRRVLLIRCPIVRDASKWAKWEKEAIGWKIDFQWNRIGIYCFYEKQIGDGLLDTNPGPSDQQK